MTKLDLDLIERLIGYDQNLTVIDYKELYIVGDKGKGIGHIKNRMRENDTIEVYCDLDCGSYPSLFKRLSEGLEHYGFKTYLDIAED